MKVVFGVDHTKHGCLVWCEYPNGNCYKARFRNTYCSALVKAKQWVWDRQELLLDAANIRGEQIDFEVPPELATTSISKRITQSVDWWAAVEEQAKAEGIGPSAWLGKVAMANLSHTVAKKLKETKSTSVNFHGSIDTRGNEMPNDNTSCPNAQAAIDAGERIDANYEKGCGLGEQINDMIEQARITMADEDWQAFADGLDTTILIRR